MPACAGGTSGADDQAFIDFAAWAVTWQSTHSGLIGLAINAGKNCSIDNNINSGTAGFLFNITNVRVVGYGATLSGNYFHLGQIGQKQDTNHSTRLFTAHAGDTTITVNPSAASQPSACNSNSTCTGLFSAPGWALIAGVDLESGVGFPSSPAFFQYVQITAINSSTGVITFVPPLLHDYLTTWPFYGFSSGIDQGGPATLYAFDPSWNATVEWQGLTFTSTQQLDGEAKDITYRDATFTGSGNACAFTTQNAAFQIINSKMLSCTMEYDKMVQSATLNKVIIDQVNLQTANNGFAFNNSTARNLNGSAQNMTISNSVVTGAFQIGPTNDGRANTLVVSNSTIAALATGGINYPGRSSEGINNISGISMSGGIIAMPNTYISAGENAVAWAVPGTNICWADENNSCAQMFQITNLTQDATNTYITTNAAGGGFPSWSPTGPLAIQVHPAPIATFTNVTGNIFVSMLSEAGAAGLPLYSYLDINYVNSGTASASQDWPMWGNLQTLSANVIMPYGGTFPSTITPNNLFGMWQTASNAFTSYTPAVIQLKSGPATRSLDATGGVPATWLNSQSGDTLTTLSQQLWSPGVWRSSSSDLTGDPSHQMSVTIKATTKQNVVIPQ